jgi:putative ATP-dependent endonuclease of OLD family
LIRKLAIRNYRCFEEFNLDFTPSLNILVGVNDTGKSTIIEAINLALTGRVNGRAFGQELSPYFVNLQATRRYIESLNAGEGGYPQPPTIVIDVFLDDKCDADILRGTNNVLGEDACGLRIQAELADEFYDEYQSFIQQPRDVRLAPTEYYKVDWLGFSGNGVTARSVPVISSLVDPSTIRLQAGVDYHLQQIINSQLDPKERVELSRQYRTLREEFSEKAGVQAINERINQEGRKLTQRKLGLAIDISQRYTWEGGLQVHLDDLPFSMIGRGDQNTLKTLLAIERKAEAAHVVLLEEPENHLSHSRLRELIGRIEDRCCDKQVIIATHSNYVLNKLGLQHMILLGEGTSTRITDLPKETEDYFKKLPGYDTLRLVLSGGAILVEGPSDELIVQRAYKDARGKLPIEDGIDVISVGLSHKRFLDIATRLGRRVWVVTDNDGKTVQQVRDRFADYIEDSKVSLHTGDDPEFRTLEPQIVGANELSTLNAVLGSSHATKDDVLSAMLADKTASALAIFESSEQLTMPGYIRDVVGTQGQ